MIVSIRVNIRYKKLPEVLAASGIKPPGLTDRHKNVSFHFPSPLEKVAEGRMRLAELENLYWLSMLNR